ncbi:MAG: hypothetical protein A2W23_09590 [Planctomycetes bacterium RBG_16_43_13]|nr:MAG: hypothetical protein A2W23_09590 [Planctomycetes bacterium RBG_16_43_13]
MAAACPHLGNDNEIPMSSRYTTEHENVIARRPEADEAISERCRVWDFFASLSVTLRVPMPSHPSDARNDVLKRIFE